jgi:hypothetical protein
MRAGRGWIVVSCGKGRSDALLTFGCSMTTLCPFFDNIRMSIRIMLILISLGLVPQGLVGNVISCVMMNNEYYLHVWKNYAYIDDEQVLISKVLSIICVCEKFVPNACWKFHRYILCLTIYLNFYMQFGVVFRYFY